MNEELKHDTRPRRRRLMFLDPDFVMRMFGRGLLCNEFLNIPEPTGLPESARVLGIYWDYSRAMMAIVVEDESFEEVPWGQPMPEIKVVWNLIKLPVVTEWVESKAAEKTAALQDAGAQIDT